MTYFDPHYGAKAPEYITWTVGLERQLANNLAISVSYVGSEGHFISATSARWDKINKLPESYAALADYTVDSTYSTATKCASMNPSVCATPLLGAQSGLSSSAPMNAVNLIKGLGFTPPNPYNTSLSSYYYKNSAYGYFTSFPQFSGVTDTTPFYGNENWNALEISFKQRPEHGLNWMLNYTYSKSIDDLGSFRTYDNPRLDRSLSATDEPQNLTATVVYQLPAGKGHRFGDNLLYRAVTSDWTVSNITRYHSGNPIMVTGSGCAGSAVLDSCMPFIVPGQPGRINGKYGKNVTSANGSPNYYGTSYFLNYAAFTVHEAGTASTYGTTVSNPTNQITYLGNGSALYAPGNTPRGAALNMRAMGTYNLDFALKRTFPIYREWMFAFEADIANATNHVIWNSPDSTVNDTTYGTLTGVASQPRTVQFSGRISW
jgi:hypothetical protein